LLCSVSWRRLWLHSRAAGLAAGIFEIDGNLVSEDSTRIDWFAGSFGPQPGSSTPIRVSARVQHLPAFLDAAFYRETTGRGTP